MCGGAFAQPIAITFVVVQELADLIKCTKFCGDRLRGFCATAGKNLGSPIGKRYGPYHNGKHYRAVVFILCLLYKFPDVDVIQMRRSVIYIVLTLPSPHL
jgi:hypothetical protein